MDYLRFGVLSTAKIGIEKVIPAMQGSKFCTVSAIASRSEDKARDAAELLEIDRAYDSYEKLLEDPEIDAVYNPLPNHLHVSWSIKALEAGKHVLCEKPIGLSSEEGLELMEAAEKYPDLKVMEAFMYRFHPQWQRTKELVNKGAIGNIKTIHSFFSYYNDDPGNIRNKPGLGGGGLMDIGCYCISLSRFVFQEEPRSVLGQTEIDPKLKIDRLTSGMLQFTGGTATFTCATQLVPYQRVHIYGTEGHIEIEIPFNAPPDKPTRLWLDSGGNKKIITFESCNQYALQSDYFAQAILDDTAVPTPLSDAVANMKVIEAIFQSSEQGTSIDLKC